MSDQLNVSLVGSLSVFDTVANQATLQRLLNSVFQTVVGATWYQAIAIPNAGLDVFAPGYGGNNGAANVIYVENLDGSAVVEVICDWASPAQNAVVTKLNPGGILLMTNNALTFNTSSLFLSLSTTVANSLCNVLIAA